MWILLPVVVIVVLVIRAYLVHLQIPRYANYWQHLRSNEIQANTLRIIALGDSILQGIGASKPEKGVSGLISDYLRNQTGRPIALQNLSVTGATVDDVLKGQLSKADVGHADLVLVVVGANDVGKKTPLQKFEKGIDNLFCQLPRTKTIVADVPGVRGRAPYAKALIAAADKYGLRRGLITDALTGKFWIFRFFAGDFFHPSDYGYKLWFQGFKPQLDEWLKTHKVEKS